MAQAKVRITWHNRLEKFASDLDKALDTAQQVIEWDSDEMVPPDVARSLGFDIDIQRENNGKPTEIQQEVTEHGTDNRG